jgi:hypothetical protein
MPTNKDTQAAGAAEPPIVQELMFSIYDYAAISQGIDDAEGEARAVQRKRMHDRANELRAQLIALASTATTPSAPTDAKSAAGPDLPSQITDDMVAAGKKMLHNSNGRAAREKVIRIFSAMVEAAPAAAKSAAPAAEVSAAMGAIAELLAGLVDESEWTDVEAKLNVVCAALSTATAPSAPTDAKSAAPAEVRQHCARLLFLAECIDRNPRIEHDSDDATYFRELAAALSTPMPAAPSAPDSAAPSSLSAEPIYQVRNSFLSDPPNVWRDAEVFAYDVSPEEDRRILFDTPSAQAPAIQAPEALQELHGLLYLAQRTTGEAQAESIGKARLLLSRLRDKPQAEPDLTEDGAIWKAIIAWADARNSAHAVSGGHAAAVDSAIRAATTEECPYCHDCWPECLHCDGTGRATPSAAVPAIQAPEAVVTDEMVTAYLKANDEYWRRTDELPGRADKWRKGTPQEATRESLIAALAITPSAAVSAAVPVPEGWKLVPIQDTPTMWTAGGNAIAGCGGHARDAASLAYAAMLDAAPAPTQPQQGTGSGK